MGIRLVLVQKQAFANCGNVEILLLGTGASMSPPPQFIRDYLRSLGIQLDFMDTVSYLAKQIIHISHDNLKRNACSTYNLLSEEGRRVAAALLPATKQTWSKQTAT